MEGTPVLRVRLLSLDYAMTPRRPAVDGTVAAPELPVLRLVGATAAGQSVCLHVHQVFPYLFVPYPDPPTTAAEGACVCVCVCVCGGEDAIAGEGRPEANAKGGTGDPHAL
jgi:hypothetical protein